MTPFRFSRAGLATLLSIAALPALAAVSVPLRPISAAPNPKAEEAIADAIECLAGVLSFHVTEGKAACTRLIASTPDEPLGYKFRGFAFLLEHDFEKAEEDFHAAVRLDPEDPESRGGYGQSFSGQGRYEAAITHFNEALRLKPRDIRFLAARCWARMGEGKNLEAALADCNQAAAIAPDFTTARLNRGMVRLKQQNYRAAVQDFSRALDLDSDLPSALFGRGLAYLSLKDEIRAAADIRAARKEDASIDNLFIRAGILPSSCHDASAPCPLPPDLRSAPASALAMVSYQRSSTGESGMNDLDEAFRAFALDRIDRMLATIAKRYNTSLGADFGARLYSPSTEESAHHIMRVQQEFRRLQSTACRNGNMPDRLCRMPNFHYSAMMRDDAQALRVEIEHSLDEVRALWLEICRQPSPDGSRCSVE